MISAKLYNLNHRQTSDELQFKDTLQEKLAGNLQKLSVLKAKHTQIRCLGLKETAEERQLDLSATEELMETMDQS